MRVWTLDERQSQCSRFTSDMFNQTIPSDQFYWWRKSEYPERTIDHGQATRKLLSLAAASRVHPFCNLQSRARIGDRLVWVVISNDLTHWSTRTPAVMYNTSLFQYTPRFYLDWCCYSNYMWYVFVHHGWSDEPIAPPFHKMLLCKNQWYI
jgi:hypothetical protein